MQVLTKCDCIDNSGVTKVKIIKIYGHSNMKQAKLGDKVCVVILRINKKLKNLENKMKKRKFRIGSLKRAIIVNSKYRFFRYNRTWMTFLNNSVVLCNVKGYPIAKKIKGYVPLEVAFKFPKLASICKGVI